MEQVRRVRRSEAAWRQIIARQTGSGQSVEQFFAGEGLSRSVFNRWRLRLSGGASIPVLGELGMRSSAFIEVGAPGSVAAGTIRLELGAGVVLTIQR